MPPRREPAAREPVLLDCHTPDTAVGSLAAASGRPAADLTEAIASVHIDQETITAETDTAIPRRVFARLGLTDDDFRFDGTCFFHGTRTLDPSGFHRDGILPLGHVLDRIWDDLHSLIQTRISPVAWRKHRTMVENGGGGHGGYLYRVKTERPTSHGGPYGFLVREHHTAPLEINHDYLAIPEIVEDIARTCDFDLQQIFGNTARPHVVKFRTTETSTHLLHSAFWYIHTALHGEKAGWYSLYAHDCRNTIVPPEDVLDVAPVEDVGPASPAIHSGGSVSGSACGTPGPADGPGRGLAPSDAR
ncbi:MULTISPECIES: hypothetical protein [Actinosynnema]|uniref:hypothetical protein n=1 Tax=Actinosynnema TaxID=40566 RepID=UPI0020A41EDB|nr:hypothetical protein [Actinosynnema pretiosum]MCP2100013.1 hypothetical protein [Actinosynnema pretiosum]